MNLYEWQVKAIYKLFNPEGSGIVKAVTGAGKSMVGKTVADQINGETLVMAHRNSILDQWRLIFKGYRNVEYMTYQKACKHDFKKPYDLTILDECHRSVSPEHIKIFDKLNSRFKLGLSATPTEKCYDKIGKLLIEVGYDEANICPFVVHFHGVNLSWDEKYEYMRLSNSIKRLMDSDDEEDKDKLKALILKRRDLVYNAKRRLDIALPLIESNYHDGRKILVFCQRIDQADKIGAVLEDNNVPHIVYHSDRMDDLEDYRTGKVRILISVGMVREGFNDVDSDCGIIVSTTLSESFHIQTIGRCLRYKVGKQSDVHILLANGTTDMTVLNYSDNYDFDLTNIDVPIDSEHKKDYYDGDIFGFNHKLIWKRVKDRRQFVVMDEKAKNLFNMLREYKFKGGKFTINENGVFIRVDKEIHKVTDEVPDFEFEPLRSYSDSVSFDELFNNKKNDVEEKEHKRIAGTLVDGTYNHCPIKDKTCSDWDYIREVCGNPERCGGR